MKGGQHLPEAGMRKTADLINEMIAGAKGAFLVAIVVGFEKETQFVFSSDIHPLDTLNRLVTKGGSAVGLLRFDRVGAEVEGSYRPFEEYGNEEWVKTYLAGLLNHPEEIIAQSGHRLVVPAAS